MRSPESLCRKRRRKIEGLNNSCDVVFVGCGNREAGTARLDAPEEARLQRLAERCIPATAARLNRRIITYSWIKMKIPHGDLTY